MAQRWRAMGIAAVLAAALVTGCGSGGTVTPPPTPPPTAVPTPTPSPTPDPVALAIAGFAAKDLRCQYTNEGTATIGSVAVAQSGQGHVDGDNEDGTTESKVGGVVIEARETKAIGPKEWERVAGGPWHDKTPTNGPLVDALAGITSLTVVGQETLDGTPVTHVRPAPGVTLDPKRWGPTDDGITGLTITVDLWIHADGTLAKMVREAKWTQASGSTAVKVQATGTTVCRPLPAGFMGITAPSDPWVAYTSTAQGYTISQPAGFTMMAGDGGDAFVYGEDVAISVASDTTDVTALDAYLAALVKSYASQVKAKLLTTEDVTIDGHPAKLAVFQAADSSGADIRLVDAVAVREGKAWEIYVVGLPDTLQDDIRHLRDSLSTFEFAT